VPRRVIAAVARAFYNEPYSAMPMRHSIEMENGALKPGGAVEYGWRHAAQWNSLRAVTCSAPASPREGSEEEFITEHYWGYTAQRNGGCKEYRVEHPRWNVWPTQDASLECDVAALYGTKFAQCLAKNPQTAFVADGSPVMVGQGAALSAV
jgi:hypothetical protein